MDALRRIVVVCSVVLSCASFAQNVVSRSGVAMESNAARGSSAIMEFREPLRVASASSGARALAVAVDARRKSLQADLARIDGDRAQVKEVYARAFNGVAVTLSPDAWDEVAKLPYVKRIVPDLTMHAYLSQSVPQIGAPAVWTSYGTRGSGVVVAVIDTGVDYHHPALGGGIGPGFRVVRGYDFINDDSDPMDDNGHGTHVAGIVGANSPTITGVAPDVTFLAYKVLNAQGSGEASQVIAGIDRALDPDGNGDSSDHADVINLSLGAPGSPDDPVAQAVENAIAHGVVVVAAAGNAFDFFTIGSPAVAPHAITVGASELGGTIAFFSSKGPNTQLYSIKPEVVAPGVNIVSTFPGGGQQALSGTSMAAPHVAGAAALLLAIHPEWTPAEVKSALVSTAFALNDEVMAQGAGRIDVSAAASATLFTNPATLSFGLADVATDHWSPSQTVRVTNRGTSAVTLTTPIQTAPNVALPQWTITPGETTLAPGASTDVVVTMSVDHAASLYPTGGSLSYGGAVTLGGSRVPWAYVKASRIRVQVDDGTPTAFVSDDHQRYRVIPSGTHVADSILPAGTYDVVTWIAHPDEGRLSVHQNVEVRGTKVIDIATSTLRNTITAAGVDEHGVLLSTLPRVEGIKSYQSRLRLVYPEENLNNYFDSAFLTVTRFRTNDLPPTWQVLVGEFYEDGPANTSYAVQHTPLVGVNANATLNAPMLREQPIRVLLPHESEAHRISLGNAKHDRYAGRRVIEPTNHIYRSAFSNEWLGRVFMTSDVHPIFGFSPSIGLHGMAQYDLDDFEATPLRLFADGRTAAVAGITAGPATQWHAPGAIVTLGAAPIHPQIEFTRISPSMFHANFFFHGPNRERRWRDIYSTRWAAFDQEGKSIGSGVMNSSNLLVQLPKPGAFRLELTDDRYWVGATRGLATYRMWSNSEAADALPPAFSALSLQNEAGAQLESVRTGQDAWLLFAITDMHGDSFERVHKPIAKNATRVEYRVSGTSAWLFADPQFIAEDTTPTSGDRTPDGAVYRCRIPTSRIATTIDIRITAEDSAGNRIEYTLEPAFAFEGADGGGRKRAVRH